MRKLYTVAVFFIILFPVSSNSAVVGDINSDGQVDLTEAMYALQVASGLYPDVSASCLLNGKGGWDNGTSYVECDVVSSGGNTYACKTSHISNLKDAFFEDVANWEPLTLQGEQGPAGTTSWTDGTGQVTTDVKVGIGDSTPDYKLDVKGAVVHHLASFRNDNNAIGSLYAKGIYSIGDAFDTETGKAYGGEFYAKGGSTSGHAYGSAHYAYAYGSSDAYGVFSNATQGTTTGHEYAFWGEGDAFFSGNVGIGKWDPMAKLHIMGNGFPDSFAYFDTISSDQDAGIRFYENGWVKGHIYHDASGDAIKLTYDGGWDQLVLKSGGNVGINDATPSYKLTVNGTAYASGAAGSLSDRRHKENIEDLSMNALEVVDQLRPVSFDWIEPADNGMLGVQLGFIAQEVEEVLPEVVLTGEDEEQTKALKYSAIIPVLTKAIQDLKAENEALAALVCMDHPEADICR